MSPFLSTALDLPETLPRPKFSKIFSCFRKTCSWPFWNATNVYIIFDFFYPEPNSSYSKLFSLWFVFSRICKTTSHVIYTKEWHLLRNLICNVTGNSELSCGDVPLQVKWLEMGEWLRLTSWRKCITKKLIFLQAVKLLFIAVCTTARH
jgi:hypothetical protein